MKVRLPAGTAWEDASGLDRSGVLRCSSWVIPIATEESVDGVVVTWHGKGGRGTRTRAVLTLDAFAQCPRRASYDHSARLRDYNERMEALVERLRPAEYPREILIEWIGGSPVSVPCEDADSEVAWRRLERKMRDARHQARLAESDDDLDETFPSGWRAA